MNGVRHQLADGRVLFEDVVFRVGDGAKVALVGANGAGKTTLLRIIAGDVTPQAGSVVRSGGLGVMRQFVGRASDPDEAGALPPGATLRDLLVSLAPAPIRAAAAALDAAELAMMESDDEPTQLRYAQALADWGDAGGYDAEVLWDTCTIAALGIPYDRAQFRELATLSGGEQKRLALEALLRGPDEVLLLDEPDNFLDVPGKRWLEDRLLESPKTVLLVSHDRELLSRTANRIVTVESASTWVHGGGFAIVPRRPPGSARAPRRAAPALGRGAREAQGAGDHVPAEGRVQLRHGQPAAGRRDAAGAVREGRPARGAAQGAEDQDAAARRADRACAQ